MERLSGALLSRCFRRCLSLSMLIVLVLTALPLGAVHASGPPSVLDQSFITPGGSGSAINGCCRYIAQTFTSGMTGALTAVSLDVASSSTVALKVAIHGVTNGLPDSSILSEVFVWSGAGGVPQSSAPLTLLIDVGQVYVQAGHQYAIVVNYDTGALGGSEGDWLGATGDYYTGGAAFATNDETFATWTPLGTPALDLHFKTYVVPNVPVSDLSVTRKRGANSATACREFFEIYTITNNGPDTAERVVLGIGLTDQFDQVSVRSFPGGQTGPFTLKPGQSMDIKAVIKVTAFVPGESREGRVSARVSMDSYPDITIDPNSANDITESMVYLRGRQVLTCR